MAATLLLNTLYIQGKHNSSGQFSAEMLNNEERQILTKICRTGTD